MGLPRTSIVLVIGLVAMFNYLTRVADGTGVEADYRNELPEFVYRGRTAAVQRPGPEQWPPVDTSLELLSALPATQAAWSHWRDYVLNSADPISPATRSRLRSIAARAACDGSIEQPDEPDGAELARFADKLSQTPWLMGQVDADALRSTGLDDRAILHVISVVAYQSAESRLRIGLSALARSTG